MSFKFASLQAIMNSNNNPRIRATAAIKNGSVFNITDKYSNGGSKSTNTITVTGTPAADTLKISVGGLKVNVAITATTLTATATAIYNALTPSLVALGYTVTNPSAGVVLVTAPANGSDTSTVALVIVNYGTTGLTLTGVVAAGALAVTYPEATAAIGSLAATDKYYIALNTIDTPELWKKDDFVIAEGGYVNGFELATMVGYPVEIASSMVTTAYASVDADGTDFLVPDTSNAYKWVKADSKGNAAVAIKVLEKTTFGGTGFYGKLV